VGAQQFAASATALTGRGLSSNVSSKNKTGELFQKQSDSSSVLRQEVRFPRDETTIPKIVAHAVASLSLAWRAAFALSPRGK
jgi:hypothetical protein